ncbi:MAG TPA: TetR/AcrR family transcriptional regulator [Zeimonas sp.]|nr:TetR/AcrR family transcriptional regulator [Zeimonas sp.]
MPPRPYNSETRRRKQAELRERIAAAAAELHAQRGAVATSNADIARQAGVSLPTVYSHFPSQDDLLGACTAHVAGRAPQVPVEQILGAPDLRAATERLVDAADALNAHFAPWKAWREDRVIPFLARMSDAARAQQTALIAQLLERHFGAGDHREVAATWETLLSFDPWHRMVLEHGLPRPAVRRQLVQMLLAVVGPQPAARSHSRPRSTKS